MPVEFVGGLFPRDQLNRPTSASSAIDLKYLRDLARAHEHAGFDSVLTLTHDPLVTATYVASQTDYIRFMIAHRPAVTAPTIAARAFATADHLTGGNRLRLHAITGITAEPGHGEFLLDKTERYKRTSEYLDIMKLAWTSEEPFDYEGQYFNVKGAFNPLKPVSQPHIPISFGGSSDIAYEVAAKHAELYALWGEPLADVKEQIQKLRTAAEKQGKETPRVSLSVRLIIGETEELAWKKAYQIQEALQRSYQPQANRIAGTGTQRLLAAAERGERHDKALWMSTATAVGATHDSTALVGTPDTIIESLLDYYDAGVTTFLNRGYDPLHDALEYGRLIIPEVRAEVAKRERIKANQNALAG